MAKVRLVIVDWEDSHHGSGWTAEPIEVRSIVVQSVGWIVGENSSAIVLAANLTQEEQAQRCGTMTIPRSAILKIRRLKL